MDVITNEIPYDDTPIIAAWRGRIVLMSDIEFVEFNGGDPEDWSFLKPDDEPEEPIIVQE